MDPAGLHRWHRSTYPLAQLSPPTSAEEAARLFLHGHPKDTAPNPDSTAWHRPAKEIPKMGHVSLQLGNDGSLSNREHTEDAQASDNSSIAVSMSQRSVSLSSAGRDDQSRSGNAENPLSSHQLLPKNNQSVDSLASSSWTRSKYPLRVTPETPTDLSPVSTPPAEEEHELTPIQTPTPDQNGVMKKTLRRTPRSRRIGSPIPQAEMTESLPVVHSTENEQSVTALGKSSWKRQEYPSQSTTLSPGTQPLAQLPSKEGSGLANGAYSHTPEKMEKISVASGEQHRAVDPEQPSGGDSAALSQSSPSSDRDEDTGNKSPIYPTPKNNQAAHSKEPWHRQTYPLQAPASNANLRQPLTPPPSPGRNSGRTSKIYADQHQEAQENEQSHEDQHSAIRSKTLHRQIYPLQSPASIADLQHSPVSSTVAEMEFQTKDELVINHTSEKAVSQNNDSTPEDDRSPEIGHNQEHAQASTKARTLRRQIYPLQSPASIPNLQPLPLPSPTPPPRIDTGFQKKDESPVDQPRENDQAVKSSKAPRRQVYPLQSPASIADFKSSLLSPSTYRGFQKKDESSANQSREDELAAKVLNQWRRLVYPMQSPEQTLPFQRLPTPQPPEEAEGKDPKLQTIHLPKNIRALKSAEKDDFKGRSLIVCLDGTGDKFDNDNSNIVQLVSAFKKDDLRQMSYYQAGIGTYGPGGLSGGFSAAMDMAVGSSLGTHIRDAYHFLMHTYKEGDKICIFGFSRGAYTARCLAGMIHKVGLLPPRNVQQIPFAYEFYKNDTLEGWKQSNDFKKTFSIDVCVYFLGCFDSVDSVGFIPRQLPLSTTPTNKPRYFRHAMALDERRAKFKICRHRDLTWDEIKKKFPSSTQAVAKAAQSELHNLSPIHKDQNDAPPTQSLHLEHKHAKHPNITNEEYESLTGHEAPFETDVLEVWFAGAHADVGGGAVPNDERHKLAQIPLRWMIRQAFECNTGIIFKTAVLAEQGLDVHTLWPEYKRLSVPTHPPPPSLLEKYEESLPPRSHRRAKLVPINKRKKGEEFYHLKSHTDEDWTPEQVEDFYDAMSPLNDQLVQAPNWWLLELWPVSEEIPGMPDEVSWYRTGMNLGRYRGVQDSEPNVHWTVQHRVKHIGYKIRARTAAHTTWRSVV